MKKSYEKHISVIRERVDLLTKMNEHVMAQRELISECAFDKLILSLETGQEIMKTLCETDGLFKKACVEIEALLKNKNNTYPLEACEFNDLKKKSEILLKHIDEANRINEKAAEIKLGELKSKIKTINVNKKGLSVYNNINVSLNSSYIDNDIKQ
jgi:spore maturation protein CgeB